MRSQLVRMLAGAVVCLGFAGSVSATQVSSDAYVYRVLFDTDSNSSTGCDVAAHDANFAGPVPGVEYVLSARIQRFPTTAHIDEVFLQECISGSTLTDPTPISSGDWDAGLENGIGGADIAEFFVPRNAIGDPSSTTLGFHATRALLMTNDVLLTTNGQNEGNPIVLTLRGGAGVPALSMLGLLLCIVLLTVIAVRRLGLQPHRSASAVTLIVALVGGAVVTTWAVTISLDGAVGDWATVPSLGTDPIGDSSIDDPAEDIVAAFATFDAQNIYFRMDVVNLAPVVCGNDILEPGEACEEVADCLIHFEALEDRGGAAGGACVCVSCQCQGGCD